MQHSFPLSMKEALGAQETHQPLTQNYLKELGGSSCPQIIVKNTDSQRAPYGADYMHLYASLLYWK